MKKNIYALSEMNFKLLMKDKGITDENVHEHKGTAFIQIINSDRDDFHFKDADNVIGLKFDDADEVVRARNVGALSYKGVYPMTKAQAKKLYKFIERNKEKGTFVVHCKAGQSRSGGVTKFLSEMFGISDLDYRLANPRCTPNMRIVNLLRNEKGSAKEREEAKKGVDE